MMALRTIAALFDTKREAQDAEHSLAQEKAGSGKVKLVQDTTRGLPVPAEDRTAYDEGLRRGGTLLLAQVEEGEVDAVIAVLETAGAVNLDAREQDWRAAGWMGDGAPTSSSMPAGATAQERSVPVVEEHLVIGKRDVARGTVRVRVHVVEVPVEVPVHLREEHAVIARHPVNQPLASVDADVFQEKVLEVETVAEEPVVTKKAVIVEELVVHKEMDQRVETVRDTVRRTEVEVEPGPSTQSPADTGCTRV